MQIPREHYFVVADRCCYDAARAERPVIARNAEPLNHTHQHGRPPYRGFISLRQHHDVITVVAIELADAQGLAGQQLRTEVRKCKRSSSAWAVAVKERLDALGRERLNAYLDLGQILRWPHDSRTVQKLLAKQIDGQAHGEERTLQAILRRCGLGVVQTAAVLPKPAAEFLVGSAR